MIKTVLYLFITSLVLVLFGWFMDSDKVKQLVEDAIAAKPALFLI